MQTRLNTNQAPHSLTESLPPKLVLLQYSGQLKTSPNVPILVVLAATKVCQRPQFLAFLKWYSCSTSITCNRILNHQKYTLRHYGLWYSLRDKIWLILEVNFRVWQIISITCKQVITFTEISEPVKSLAISWILLRDST